MSRGAWGAVLLGAMLLVPTVLWGGQVVRVKGMSFVEPGREAIARDKALEDAKRMAVEQAVGVSVSSTTVVEDFRLVKDRIMSQASGYIKRFDVLAEGPTDLGSYEVEVEAEVEVADVVGDLDRFKQMLGFQKNPRVSVVSTTGPDAAAAPASRKAVDLLMARLQESGFVVYDAAKSDRRQMGLQVALNLEVASRQSDYQGVKLSLNEVSMSANIIRPGDGQVLAAAAAVKNVPGENQLQALDKGARACLDALWADLRVKLTRTWEKELYSERDLFVNIRGLATHAAAEQVAADFRADVRGVSDMQLMRFAAKRGEYRVRYRGWPEHFVSELQMAHFRKTHFDPVIEAMEGNHITIAIP